MQTSVYTPSAPNYTTALDFTGTQHIKSIGTRSFNNFSISFWFNTATTPSAFEGYVSGQTGTGNDYSLGGFSIYYYNGGLALQSSNVNFNLSFTNNIILGNWNHIVVDIDNSNSFYWWKIIFKWPISFRNYKLVELIRIILIIYG